MRFLRKFVEATLSRDFDLETFAIKAVEECLDLDLAEEVWTPLKVSEYILDVV